MIPSDVTVTYDPVGGWKVSHPKCVSGRVIPDTDITQAVEEAEDHEDSVVTVGDFEVSGDSVSCRHCGDWDSVR